MESMGNIGQRLQAAQLRDEGLQEAKASLLGQQDQLDAMAGELPEKKDESAMGISIGSAGGLKAIVEKSILPRLETRAKAAASAKLSEVLDNSLKAARGRGLSLFNPDELTRFQNARDTLRGMSADARARVWDSVQQQRNELASLASNTEANATDVLRARRRLMTAVEQRLEDERLIPPRGMQELEIEEPSGLPEAVPSTRPPITAESAAPAEPDDIPDTFEPADSFQPGIRAAAARAPTFTERIGSAVEGAQDVAGRVGGAVQEAAQAVSQRVSGAVNTAQRLGQDFMQGVRTRISAATAPYQADLAGAAERQAASGAIINQDHLDQLSKQFGINTEGLDSDAVDLGMRSVLGDEATQTVARGLSGVTGLLGGALEALGPLADVAGVGFGIESIIQGDKEQKQEEIKQNQLETAVNMLGVPMQAPGLGTAPVLDTRVDRSGGMMNF